MIKSDVQTLDAFNNLMTRLGPSLTQALCNQVAGNVLSEDLNNTIEPITLLVKKGDEAKRWFSEALNNLPVSQVSQQRSQMLLQQLFM